MEVHLTVLNHVSKIRHIYLGYFDDLIILTIMITIILADWPMLPAIKLFLS